MMASSYPWISHEWCSGMLLSTVPCSISSGRTKSNVQRSVSRPVAGLVRARLDKCILLVEYIRILGI